jgi:hypothetical protein
MCQRLGDDFIQRLEGEGLRSCKDGYFSSKRLVGVESVHGPGNVAPFLALF